MSCKHFSLLSNCILHKEEEEAMEGNEDKNFMLPFIKRLTIINIFTIVYNYQKQQFKTSQFSMKTLITNNLKCCYSSFKYTKFLQLCETTIY